MMKITQEAVALRFPKSILATALAVTIFISATPAQAQETHFDISGTDKTAIQQALETSEAEKDTAKKAIASFTNSTAPDAFDNLIDKTLDLSGTEDSNVPLPHITKTGGLSLINESTGESLSIEAATPSNSTHTIDGLAHSETTDGIDTFTHITGRRSGQILAVLTPEDLQNSVDFSLSLPERYNFSLSTDGSVNITNQSGETEGSIAQPWAVDSAGNLLPTYFEVTDSGVRQHVDRSAAIGDVVLDPDIQWWAATAANCALAIAPVLAPGGIGAAAKLAKLTSKLNDAIKKNQKLAKIVEEAGGQIAYVQLQVKAASNAIRDKLPEAAQKVWPAFPLNEADTARVAAASGFSIEFILDALGIDSCFDLGKEITGV
ncbi:MAG: hypothetical protein Q4A03_02320 [Rothia sp. (in: high G+C Gram-positive bacteria)]|uniref:hypothetical protein n=1 Tax=Rothia sp. (in: high G+C Gram-positive bacteria) TaxID=1885016 RepID=UPI0027119202|nr:hypothetical protein [Rothia sp. (in: high G+C Gram-positive bacteria)]